jgi:hypothetical protein
MNTAPDAVWPIFSPRIPQPRRLAMRYLKHNPRFVFKFLGQLLSRKD